MQRFQKLDITLKIVCILQIIGGGIVLLTTALVDRTDVATEYVRFDLRCQFDILRDCGLFWIPAHLAPVASIAGAVALFLKIRIGLFITAASLALWFYYSITFFSLGGLALLVIGDVAVVTALFISGWQSVRNRQRSLPADGFPTTK